MLSLIPRFSPWPVPRPIYDVGPGPVALLRGNYDHGWFGEVAASELITGEALAAKLGLTAGTPHNNATPWLKFAYQGKFLFMPKRPLRVDLSWNDILAVSAVYGDKVIQVGNHLFKVRLPKGALTDPAVVTQGNVQWGSEWDYTYGHVRGPTAYVSAANAFASYTIEDTLTTTAPDLAFYAMCMESMQVNTQHIKRQDVATYNVDTYKSWSRYDYGWRPVLEYVGPAIVGYDPNLWLQYSFLDNESINDVTETFAALENNAIITDNKLVTVTASDILSSPGIVMDEPAWSIETMFNYVSTSANMGLIGVWNGSGNAATRWYLLWENAANAMRLYFRNTSGQIIVSKAISKPAANTEHHIELSYADGTFYMFLNGELIHSAVGDGINALNANTPLSMISGGNTFNGKRWNTRIVKGRALHTSAFTPSAELPKVGRLMYDQETSDAIRVQMDLRRDNAINEANLLGVQMYGTARVAQSAITQTGATTSYLKMYTEYFGAGDFTIELEFNLTAINATYGTVLAGQWHYGATTHVNNCWYLHCTSNRLLSFGISKSAAASDHTAVSSAANAFALNTDNKLVIERIAGKVTMYMNGIQIAQGVHPQPIRKVEPCFVRSLSAANLYVHAGKIWNLRIADKAMYNGVITHEPQFPKLRPRQRYEQSVLDDIVCQVSLRNGNPRNEKTGQSITVSGTGAVMADGITTTLVNTSRFYIPLPHFGAADFTIELKLVMLFSSGASTRPIFGQFQGGAGPNSWIFYTLGTNIAFQALTVEGNSVTVDSATAGKTWVAGVEYHVVVERVGTTLSMYIDGVLMDSGTLVGDLVNMDAYPHITNLYDTSTAKFCASKIRDVRIAKRAMFNGNVQRQPLPEIPNQKPSLMMASVTDPALHGAAQNLDYMSGLSSAGVFSHTLFRDVRDPQNIKTVRLVALVNDRSYTVLGMRPSDIPPTADMPQLTNTLKIGETTLTLSSGFGASVKAGAIGLYWNGNLLGANAPGKCVPFEFV